MELKEYVQNHEEAMKGSKMKWSKVNHAIMPTLIMLSCASASFCYIISSQFLIILSCASVSFCSSGFGIGLFVITISRRN